LVSRRGNVYKRFTELAAAIHIQLDCEAVLDGEIVCLDENGRPQFYDLPRRRGAPVLYAFEVLWLDGNDVRSRPLAERKRLLRSIVPEQPSVKLSAEDIEGYCVEFFRLACEQDLEGIVAKRKHGAARVCMAKAGSRSAIHAIRSMKDGRRCLRRSVARLRHRESLITSASGAPVNA
jgi:ATP-dependent DNA ligase